MSDEDVQAEIDAAKAELAQAEASLAADHQVAPAEDFSALDAALKTAGLDPRNGRPPGNDEGLEHSRTQMLREAQLRFGLPVTGEADAATIAALGME